MYYPYSVLGVEETATDEEIRRAYFEKLRQYPGEHCPREFQAVTAAYNAIRDELSRTKLLLFDKLLKQETDLADIWFVDRSRRYKIGIKKWETIIAQHK